ENIDPNTIADVTILKDASAASIWGARAGNGVIVITSKKGAFNQKMRISFNTNQSIIDLPKFPKEYTVGAKTHIEMEKFLFDQGYFDERLKVKYNGQTPIVNLLDMLRSGSILKNEFDEQMSFWSKQNSVKNYLKEFYNIGFTQNYG